MSLRSTKMCCFQTLKAIPVLFILSIVAWSYYAYVMHMCFWTIDSSIKKAFYLLIYHPLLFIFLVSYYRTMFTSLAGPTNDFYIGDAESERIATAQSLEERCSTLIRLNRRANLPTLTRHFDGSIRYCFLCRCIKPDRAHHCSVCGKCVLRYDHHCPWTNSCISFTNYKFFVLFLGWALIFCAFVAITSFEYFVLFWQELNGVSSSAPKFHLLFLFFAALMFSISVASLLFYHLFLISKNRTTLESFRTPIFVNGPQKHGFDLGWKKNFEEIFGKNLYRALLPIYTTRGDGIHYQVNSLVLGGIQSYQNENRVPEVLVPLDPISNGNTNDRNYLFKDNLNSR